MQNCYLFCRLGQKLRKGTFFWKKYFQLSSEWYFKFDVNIVRSSSIFQVAKRCFKAQKRNLFFGFKRSHGAKRYLFCSWKRCSQKRENDTFKVFKTKNSVFKLLGSHWKSSWLTEVNRWHILSFNERCTDFFKGILGDSLKIEMIYKGNKKE